MEQQQQHEQQSAARNSDGWASLWAPQWIADIPGGRHSRGSLGGDDVDEAVAATREAVAIRGVDVEATGELPRSPSSARRGGLFESLGVYPAVETPYAPAIGPPLPGPQNAGNGNGRNRGTASHEGRGAAIPSREDDGRDAGPHSLRPAKRHHPPPAVRDGWQICAQSVERLRRFGIDPDFYLDPEDSDAVRTLEDRVLARRRGGSPSERRTPAGPPPLRSDTASRCERLISYAAPNYGLSPPRPNPSDERASGAMCGTDPVAPVPPELARLAEVFGLWRYRDWDDGTELCGNLAARLGSSAEFLAAVCEAKGGRELLARIADRRLGLREGRDYLGKEQLCGILLGVVRGDGSAGGDNTGSSGGGWQPAHSTGPRGERGGGGRRGRIEGGRGGQGSEEEEEEEEGEGGDEGGDEGWGRRKRGKGEGVPECGGTESQRASAPRAEGTGLKDLPAEIVEHVLRHLDTESLAAARLVARPVRYGGSQAPLVSSIAEHVLTERAVSTRCPPDDDALAQATVCEAIANDDPDRLRWLLTNCPRPVDLTNPMATAVVERYWEGRRWMVERLHGGYPGSLVMSTPAGLAAATGRYRVLPLLVRSGALFPSSVALFNLALATPDYHSIDKDSPPGSRAAATSATLAERRDALRTAEAVLACASSMGRSAFDDNPLATLRQFAMRTPWLVGNDMNAAFDLARKVLNWDPTFPEQRAMNTGWTGRSPVAFLRGGRPLGAGTWSGGGGGGVSSGGGGGGDARNGGTDPTPRIPREGVWEKTKATAGYSEADALTSLLEAAHEVRARRGGRVDVGWDVDALFRLASVYLEARNFAESRGLEPPQVRKSVGFDALRRAVGDGRASEVERLCLRCGVNPDAPMPYGSTRDLQLDTEGQSRYLAGGVGYGCPYRYHAIAPYPVVYAVSHGQADVVHAIASRCGARPFPSLAVLVNIAIGVSHDGATILPALMDGYPNEPLVLGALDENPLHLVQQLLRVGWLSIESAYAMAAVLVERDPGLPDRQALPRYDLSDLLPVSIYPGGDHSVRQSLEELVRALERREASKLAGIVPSSVLRIVGTDACPSLSCATRLREFLEWLDLLADSFATGPVSSGPDGVPHHARGDVRWNGG